MTQPKTYDGKFRRLKSLVDNFDFVRFAILDYVDSRPEDEFFYEREAHLLDRLQVGLKLQGKSSKSAFAMAKTLRRAITRDVFPQIVEPHFIFATPSFSETPEMRAELARDMHATLYGTPIHEKIGLRPYV